MCRVGRDVAQAAGRALDVGLELVDRVVERRVPLVDELQQRIEQPPPVVGAEAPHPAVEPLKEPLVAGDEPDVEQRQQEFGVPQVERGRLGEIGELPDVLADGQPEIPERLEQRADEALLARPHRVLEEDEEVDVGVQAERLPAVAPEGHDRHGGAGVHARVLRELLHQRVDAARVAGPGRPALRAHAGRRRCIPAGHRRAPCSATACSLRCVTRVLPIPIDSKPGVPWSTPIPEQVGSHTRRRGTWSRFQGLSRWNRCARRNRRGLRATICDKFV